jgi:ankyrin repeat protein
MMNAAAFGHLAIVESLLRLTNANEQVAQQNKAGETAQMSAQSRGHHDIAAKIGALNSKIEKQ